MCLLERILSYNNLFMREFTNKAAKLAHKGAYSHDSIDGNFNRIILKIMQLEKSYVKYIFKSLIVFNAHLTDFKQVEEKLKQLLI